MGRERTPVDRPPPLQRAPSVSTPTGLTELLNDEVDSVQLPRLSSLRSAPRSPRIKRGSPDSPLKSIKQQAQSDGRLQALIVRAENLAVPLPPVAQELERLVALQATLGERADVTTLGDVLAGPQPEGGLESSLRPLQADPGLVRRPQRGWDRVELKAARDSAAAMTHDLSHWVADVQLLRRPQHAAASADRDTDIVGGAAQIDSDDERELKQRVEQTQKRLAERDDESRRQLNQFAAIVRGVCQRVEWIRQAMGTGVGSKEAANQLLDDASKPPPQLGRCIVAADTDGDGPAGAAHDASVRHADPHNESSSSLPAVAPPPPASKQQQQQPAEGDTEAGGWGSMDSVLRQLSGTVCQWAQDVRQNPHRYGGILAPRGSLGVDEGEHEPEEKEEDEGEITTPLEAPDGTHGSRILAAAKEELNDDERYEEGIIPAARAAGYPTLTQGQVKEILHHFYHQPKQPLSAPMKKKRELRLHRRYVDCLKREAEGVAKLRRIITDVRGQLKEAKAELASRRERERAALSGKHDGGESQAACERYKKVVEGVFNTRVRELEKLVGELKELHDQEKAQSDDSREQFERLRSDFVDLARELSTVKEQWEEKEREFKKQREQIDRLQQGRKEKDQIWRARLMEVCRGVVCAMSELPTELLAVRAHLLSNTDPARWRSSAVDTINAGLDSMLDLVRSATENAPAEAHKITLDELQAQLSEDQRERHPAADCSQPPPDGFDKRLFEQLQEKVEMLATENRSKFREERYMKSVITYVCKTAGEVISGTYDYSKDKEAEGGDDAHGGGRFGGTSSGDFPPEVAKEDKDYAYAWIDERKLLQELLSGLKLYVRHGGAKPNSVNSLMAVLGSWREAQQQAHATGGSGNTHPSGPAATKPQSYQGRHRGARDKLHDTLHDDMEKSILRERRTPAHRRHSDT